MYMYMCIYGCVHIVYMYVRMYVHVSVTFLNPTSGVIYSHWKVGLIIIVCLAGIGLESVV